MKLILVEDLNRPLRRDPSVKCCWPLPEIAPQTNDSRFIFPAYRSLMIPMSYGNSSDNTYLLLQANSDTEIPVGAIHIYGWRDAQPYSSSKSTLQYERVDNLDFVDLTMIKLGSGGQQSVFALAVSGQWRWIQIAVFWPMYQFSLYQTDVPQGNIVSIENAPAPIVVEDIAISDDFTDGKIQVWHGGTGSINPDNFRIKDPMPFKDGDGVGQYPSGGTGQINPNNFKFTDETFAEFP
jgi:hypothetical protein